MNVRWMRLRLPCVVIKTLFVAFALSPVISPVTARGQGLAATYSHNVLHFLIPYHASRADSGQLIVELLDPEDKVIAKAERAARTARRRALPSTLLPTWPERWRFTLAGSGRMRRQ